MKEMVLIHGWDPDYYNSKMVNPPIQENVAWTHRNQLTSLLGYSFNLSYFNLPGFCGIPEPKKAYFDVEDFTDSFHSWVTRQEKPPEIILGYSFGGVIALDYKIRYSPNTPVILISPALVRSTSLRSMLAQSGKNLVPEALLKRLTGCYQYLFSRYYREGNEFLRKSYDHIARRDSANLLAQVDKTGILLIYGNQDTSTPWSLVKDKIIDANLAYHLVKNGGHSIGQTHPKEIVATINEFLRKINKNTSKTIRHIGSLLNSLRLTDYKEFNKYSEWTTKVKVLKYLEKKLSITPSHLTMYQFLMRIRKILYDLYGEKRDYGKSFVDSRFTPLSEMLQRGMLSCGALTAIYGTILRNYNIPTKWVHGKLSSQKNEDAHAWLNIYNPKTGKWISIDPTMPDFEMHPEAIEHKIYHDWNELKKDYENGQDSPRLTTKNNPLT